MKAILGAWLVYTIFFGTAGVVFLVTAGLTWEQVAYWYLIGFVVWTIWGLTG